MTRHPSTGGTTTAASSNDTIYLGVDQLNPQSATLLGVDGNDVIYLGAQGYTATASGNVPAQTIELRTGASATADTASGSITVSGALIASSIATTGITKTWVASLVLLVNWYCGSELADWHRHF